MGEQKKISGSAKALVLAGQALVLVAGLAFALLGSVDVLRAGGAFGVAVIVALLVQVGLGTLFGFLELSRPRPMILHALAPAVLACLGTLGASHGLDKVISALSLVPRDERGLLWAQGVWEAEQPAVVALFGAGLGLLALAFVALASFLEHRRSSSEPGRPFAAAMLFFVGGAGGAFLVGRALVFGAMHEGFGAAAMASYADALALAARGYARAALWDTASLIAVALLALAGVGAVFLSRGHARAWAPRGLVGLVPALALLATPLPLTLHKEAKKREVHEVFEAEAPRLPEGLALPAMEASGDAPLRLLLVREREVLFGEKRLGTLDDAAALAAALEGIDSRGQRGLSVAIDREADASALLVLAEAARAAGVPSLFLLDESSRLPEEVVAKARAVGGLPPLPRLRGVPMRAASRGDLALPRLAIGPDAVTFSTGERLSHEGGTLSAEATRRIADLVGEGSGPVALVLLEGKPKVQLLADVASALLDGMARDRPLVLARAASDEE